MAEAEQRTGRARSARIGAALAASLVVHLLGEAILPRGYFELPAPWEKSTGFAEIEFELAGAPVAAATATPLPVRASAPAGERLTALSASSAYVDEAGIGTSAPDSSSALSAAVPATAVGVDAQQITESSGSAAGACDMGTALDPHSVALAAEGVDAVPTLAERASRNTERYLRGVAQSREYQSTRPPPDLRRRGDGSYAFSSDRFHATITDEGDVIFHDVRVGMRAPGFEMQGEEPEDTVAYFFPIRISFDLTEAWMRANDEDPLRTEREWFMRGTEELRDRLHAQARARHDEGSMRALDSRLATIASDVRTSLARKHEAIFEVWDDCATDAIGDRARRHIEHFVREHFPAGTQLAFSGEELRRFNSRRANASEFAPYAQPPRDAGAG